MFIQRGAFQLSPKDLTFPDLFILSAKFPSSDNSREQNALFSICFKYPCGTPRKNGAWVGFKARLRILLSHPDLSPLSGSTCLFVYFPKSRFRGRNKIWRGVCDLSNADKSPGNTARGQRQLFERQLTNEHRIDFLGQSFVSGAGACLINSWVNCIRTIGKVHACTSPMEKSMLRGENEVSVISYSREICHLRAASPSAW